jgi:hypothetical protein
MFEELCRDTGKVRIPTGNFVDNKPEYAEHPCTYFIMSDNYRDANGVLQYEDFYMCKGLGDYEITADCTFIDKNEAEFDLRSAQRIDNLFDNVHEFYKLAVC